MSRALNLQCFTEHFDFTRRVTTNKVKITCKTLYLQHSDHSRYVSTDLFRLKISEQWGVIISLSNKVISQEYVVRISKRAKYMRLTVSLDKGLVVVVPKSVNKFQRDKLVQNFVQSKADWIKNAIQKLQAKPQGHRNINSCPLPTQVELPAIKEKFLINYVSDVDLSSLRLSYINETQLDINGNTKDKKQVFSLLEQFLKQYAYYYLEQRLHYWSEQLNLPYRRLTVRAQKTRWGSCSSQKNINLNYRLLFINTALLDYIIIHELVHTIHMNHSKAFWDYLESIIPDARIRDKQVNNMSHKLPCWVYYKSLL